MALRRSPKPGAFTAATLSPPRSRLTANVASTSPSTTSAMMTTGLPDCTFCTLPEGLSSRHCRSPVQCAATRQRSACSVRRDFLSGVRSGVNGTPTFFIDNRRYEGPPTYEALVANIAAQLEYSMMPA
jgi:hypothetical protein